MNPAQLAERFLALAVAAQALAAAGWRIHPCRAGSKKAIWTGWPERASADASPCASATMSIGPWLKCQRLASRAVHSAVMASPAWAAAPAATHNNGECNYIGRYHGNRKSERRSYGSI